MYQYITNQKFIQRSNVRGEFCPCLANETVLVSLRGCIRSILYIITIYLLLFVCIIKHYFPGQVAGFVTTMGQRVGWPATHVPVHLRHHHPGSSTDQSQPPPHYYSQEYCTEYRGSFTAAAARPAANIPDGVAGFYLELLTINLLE